MNRPTLTIDAEAVAANWRDLAARHASSGGGATAAAVKADAYGLGAALIAPALAAAGCRHFFVACLEEALALRTALPDRRIAVINGCPSGTERELIANDLRPVLNSLEDCARWRNAAREAGRALPALLHVDTGMARLGLDAAEFARLRETPDLLDGIALDYVMSHLVASETTDAPENAHQAQRFAAIRAAFPGVTTSLANSSGIFFGPDFASDLARPGFALYGGNPTPEQKNPMRPVVTLAAPILQIRAIEAGESVGYNAIWRAERQSLIATIGVGYADGMPRSLANRMTARFKGRDVRLVGRVSMDLMTFDVTDHPDIAPGSMLELIGPGHDIDDVGREAGTNGYEILTGLGRRYRRVAKSV
ncbi:alanine racemase [Acidiphilium iwatense]|uniref:Alanine racemase n=1 Tax=Acidiphilium iwatense TaxID=768198 RepID=A0ABS9DU05_9PROT|nr:alanine racemase [Acidiphilium iwatense]MCF3946179.1 alanine racemase [Acidiphilium iwatense]